MLHEFKILRGLLKFISEKFTASHIKGGLQSSGFIPVFIFEDFSISFSPKSINGGRKA